MRGKVPQGFLVLRGIDFPFTHNIARLLELCSEHVSWADSLMDAEELTPLATTARYPGDDEPVSEPEARRAIEIATHVRDTVRIALAAESMMLRPAEFHMGISSQTHA